jgi:hypothetical protein
LLICVKFVDELVKQGADGGRKAANLVVSAVKKDLQACDALPHHLQIMVGVYANAKGLARTYTDQGLVPDQDTVFEFISGFNMGDALCNYVDSGDGKETADHKIHGTLVMHLRRGRRLTLIKLLAE